MRVAYHLAARGEVGAHVRAVRVQHAHLPVLSRGTRHALAEVLE